MVDIPQARSCEQPDKQLRVGLRRRARGLGAFERGWFAAARPGRWLVGHEKGFRPFLPGRGHESVGHSVGIPEE